MKLTTTMKKMKRQQQQRGGRNAKEQQQQKRQQRQRQLSIVEVFIKSLVIVLAFVVIYGNYWMLFDKDLEETLLLSSSSSSSSSSLTTTKVSSGSLPIQKSSSSSSQKLKSNNNNNKNNNENSNKKIRDILRAANVTITKEDEKTLPKWEEVVSRFGNKPIIDGLETCTKYNMKVPFSKRHIGIAGTFNSGTNLLAQTLSANCRMRSKVQRNGKIIQEGIEWQVNWGKHTPIQFRLQNKIHSNLINEDMLPIVMIRDPWSWMQSMCRVRYSAHWYHVVAPEKNPTDGGAADDDEVIYPHHCPNLIANDIDRQFIDKTKPWLRKYYNGDVWKIDNIYEKANFTATTSVIPLWVRYKSGNINHKSLIHMWMDWYMGYYIAKYNDDDIPRLIIRLEDLVFHPRETLQQICDCVEGQFLPSSTTTTTTNNDQNQQQKHDLILVPESAKGGSEGEHIHGKNQSNLLSAMISHLRLNRTKGMTIDDIKFVLDALQQQQQQGGEGENGGNGHINDEQSINLMKIFGYSNPDIPDLVT